VIVLATLGAPQRRLLRGRRPVAVEDEPGAEPVPTSRATLVRTDRIEAADAVAWLERLRAEADALEAEAGDAVGELNAVLRAHRAAAVDPYVREVTLEQALVVRVGYGEGEQVADGRFAAALELPRERRRRVKRRVELEPQERLAAILGGHEPLLACEDLVLRARLDLDARRPREAALQARIALEALLAEVDPEAGGEVLRELAAERALVAEAANAALDGEPAPELAAAVERAVKRMETALRRRVLKRSIPS
jgi:hypothetical protein